jgi:hypothetical protein
LLPVLAKHSKSFSLSDCISVGVDRMHRNFESMRKQVETMHKSELTDVTAKVVIYEALVEGKLEAAKHLARSVHDLYFEAFEELEPIPQFKATACGGLHRQELWTLSNSSVPASR